MEAVLEQKQFQNIIFGKKILLFPLAEADVEHFIKLHRDDKKGYMQRYCMKEMTEDEAKHYLGMLIATQQIYVFTGMTKEGKASRRAGYVYITDLTTSACEISGIMDSDFVKGLSKVLRQDKYTYAQDTLHTVLRLIFEHLKLERVGMSILAKNRTAVALSLKEGFIIEGTLRHYINIDGKFEDVVMLGMLKDDWINKTANEPKDKLIYEVNNG